MRSKSLMLAAALMGAVALSAPADAKTLRFAFQGTLNSLDPYSLNETFTLGMLGNVYEGLTKRDKQLKIIPGLAESWDMPDPLHWVIVVSTVKDSNYELLIILSRCNFFS